MDLPETRCEMDCTGLDKFKSHRTTSWSWKSMHYCHGR